MMTLISCLACGIDTEPNETERCAACQPERQLWLDDCRGIYIPQTFAEEFPRLFEGYTGPVTDDIKVTTPARKSDREVLEAGPEHEWYWEAWDDVLRDVKWEEGGKVWGLEQDGALFAVHYPNG